MLFCLPPTRGQQGKDSVPFLHSLPVFPLSCFYFKLLSGFR